MAIRAVHRNPIRSVARSFFLSLGKIKRFIINLLTATSTRNSQTTCIGIASDGTFDNPVLLTVPANLPAIVGGRLATTVADGAVLGSELIADGDFSGSSWSTQTGWEETGGFGVATSVAEGLAIFQNAIATEGKKYLLCFDIIEISQGAFSPRIGSIGTGTSFNSIGRHELVLEAGAVLWAGVAAVGTTTGKIDNFSIKQVNPTWYNTDINGVHLDTALQNYGAGTNQLWPSLTPATMTTASLATGFYTLSVYGAGSALTSAGTATIVGEASATEDSPDTFEVTVAGTVTVTKTGVLSRWQLEGGLIETAHIITTTAPATRNADVTTVPTPSVLGVTGAVKVVVTPAVAGQTTKYIVVGRIDASNYFAIYSTPTQIIAQRKVLGVDSFISYNYTHIQDVKLDVDLYFSGAGFSMRAYKNGDSPPAFMSNAVAATFPVNDVLNFGSFLGSALFVGDYANDGVPVCYASKEDAGW